MPFFREKKTKQLHTWNPKNKSTTTTKKADGKTK